MTEGRRAQGSPRINARHRTSTAAVKQVGSAANGDEPGRRALPNVEENPELKPITFACEETLGMLPEQIAQQILDISRWSSFQRYGLLPGIRTADFEIRTTEIVGSRVRVTTTDGSSHVEEIVEWEPDRRVRLHMRGFSPPLSRLATGFNETWQFSRIGRDTRVVRSFELHATSRVTRPLLWLISILLKRAIARHLRQVRESTGTATLYVDDVTISHDDFQEDEKAPKPRG